MPEGAFARIDFFGAAEDLSRPFHPDLSTETGPVTDLSALDGLLFIRFEIRFEVGLEPFFPPVVDIESLRFRFGDE
jgi:hypothetical protein